MANASPVTTSYVQLALPFGCLGESTGMPPTTKEKPIAPAVDVCRRDTEECLWSSIERAPSGIAAVKLDNGYLTAGSCRDMSEFMEAGFNAAPLKTPHNVDCAMHGPNSNMAPLLEANIFRCFSAVGNVFRSMSLSTRVAVRINRL